MPKFPFPLSHTQIVFTRCGLFQKKPDVWNEYQSWPFPPPFLWRLSNNQWDQIGENFETFWLQKISTNIWRLLATVKGGTWVKLLCILFVQVLYKIGLLFTSGHTGPATRKWKRICQDCNNHHHLLLRRMSRMNVKVFKTDRDYFEKLSKKVMHRIRPQNIRSLCKGKYHCMPVLQCDLLWLIFMQ